MKFVQILTVTLLVTLAGAFPAARANEWDKATKATINEPVQIPGTVLEPGTYTFKLAENRSGRQVVQVFNDSETKLLATVLALSNYQLEPSGKTILEFAERPEG